MESFQSCVLLREDGACATYSARISINDGPEEAVPYNRGVFNPLRDKKASSLAP
jgi:hypothetical protein